MGEWFWHSFQYLPDWSMNVDDTDWNKEVRETARFLKEGKYNEEEFCNQIIKLRNKYNINKYGYQKIKNV